MTLNSKIDTKAYISTIEYYEKNAENLGKRYESADVTKMQKALKASFRPGSRLLEIGCGSGRDAAHMLANGFDVIAADGVRQMIETAGKYHPELTGRLHRIHLPGPLPPGLGYFDGAYSIATLMHLTPEDIGEVLLGMQALLYAGGLFFFSVPLRRDDVSLDDFDERGRRFTSMTDEGWFALFSNAGFKKKRSLLSDDGLGREGIVWLNGLVEKC